MTRFVVDDNGGGENKKKGKVKEKKHEPNLMFFSDYESGNLHHVKPLNDGVEYEISLRPDTLADQYRNWFFFSVFGCKPKQRVVFSIVNFSKQRSLYRDRMTPLVRSRSRMHLGWSRLPPRNCFYYKSPRHGGSYLLSFVFTFDGDENEVYDFAYSFPYSYTKLQRYLDGLQRKHLSYLERRLLCRTNQMRRVDLVEIRDTSHTHNNLGGSGALKATKGAKGGILGSNGSIKSSSANKYMTKRLSLSSVSSSASSGLGLSGLGGGKMKAGRKGGSKVRPVVAITGRVHPGETPASLVVQGFLDFVTSNSEEAVYLRKVADIVVVPMLNPDGVFLGNYRTDSTGVDLNRRWDAPNREMEPSLYWTKDLLQSINNEKGRRLDMFIDVHAHSTSKRSFMFCNPPKCMDSMSHMDSEEEMKDWSTMNNLKKVLVFLEFLDMYMLEFSLQTCRWDIDSHKVGSARRALEKFLPETLCYTFEASFFHDIAGFPQDPGFMQRRNGQQAQTEINTEKSYIGMGEQLGRALSDYYKCLETNIFQTNALPKEFAPFKAELKKESVRMEGLKF